VADKSGNILGGEAVKSGRSLSTFGGTCCLHLQGRPVSRACKMLIISQILNSKSERKIAKIKKNMYPHQHIQISQWFIFIIKHKTLKNMWKRILSSKL
jgi:hypothetical protein